MAAAVIWARLTESFWLNCQLFGLTLLFAIPLGLVVCFGSMSRFSPLRYLVKAIVWVVRGTPLKIKFDAGCDALREEVITNGWEHHYALMYGDHVDELKDLCRNLDIELHLVR